MRHRSQPAEHKLARDYMDLRAIVKDRALLFICQHSEESPSQLAGSWHNPLVLTRKASAQKSTFVSELWPIRTPWPIHGPKPR